MITLVLSRLHVPEPIRCFDEISARFYDLSQESYMNNILYMLRWGMDVTLRRATP